MGNFSCESLTPERDSLGSEPLAAGDGSYSGLFYIRDLTSNETLFSMHK